MINLCDIISMFGVFLETNEHQNLTRPRRPMPVVTMTLHLVMNYIEAVMFGHLHYLIEVLILQGINT